MALVSERLHCILLANGQPLDWVVTFEITDSSLAGSPAFKIRFFMPEGQLPDISGVGDVVILRNIMV
jgi:hypothetical protein